MAKVTIQTKLIEALLDHDYHAVKTRSTKYQVFTKYASGTYYYVGKAGALRVGHNATESIPADRFKEALIHHYDTVVAPKLKLQAKIQRESLKGLV